MKAWRRNARKRNIEASIEEGSRVTHQGRANKPFLFNLNTIFASKLLIGLLKRAEIVVKTP